MVKGVKLRAGGNEKLSFAMASHGFEVVRIRIGLCMNGRSIRKNISKMVVDNSLDTIDY